MAPTRTVKRESCWGLIDPIFPSHDERRAVKVRGRKRATDFEFFTDDHCRMFADQSESNYSPGSATLERLDIEHPTDLKLELSLQ